MELVEYDADWPRRFAEQQERLASVLEPWLSGDVEHVGSTAVPGLTAKPVVDILAPVASLTDARAALDPLADDGWLYWPDDPNRGWRMWFLRPDPERRTHHLHVIERTHPQADAMIAFRDALRASRRHRTEYAALKADLAQRHPDARNAYTNAKTDFVTRTLTSLGLDVPPPDRLPE